MKDAVNDESDDLTLARLVEITIASIVEARPLFPTLLDEPSFYRKYFKRWVKEAMADKVSMANLAEEAMKTAKSLA